MKKPGNREEESGGEEGEGFEDLKIRKRLQSREA